MLVKVLKPFNDGWTQKYRQEGEVFEATEDAARYWRSLGLIEESGESSVIDFERMNKEKLLKYAAEQGIEIEPSLTKKELIARLTARE